jgi:enhancer of polycomb-like protein
MSSRKVRVKKLSVKTPLPVLREDQIDPSEYEALSSDNQISTGVEHAEEKVSITFPYPNSLISRGHARDIAFDWSTRQQTGATTTATTG